VDCDRISVTFNKAPLIIRIFVHWQGEELFKSAVYRCATPHFNKFDKTPPA